jgi:hypothetical protein
MTPCWKLPTRSIMRQSVLPVPGESRMPRPIYLNPRWFWRVKIIETLGLTIWLNRFLDFVGLTNNTQSMLGTSAPSVKIPGNHAPPPSGISFRGSCHSDDGYANAPQLTSTGNAPLRKSVNNSRLSTDGVLEKMILASTPASLKALASDRTWVTLTAKTSVDLRVSTRSHGKGGFSSRRTLLAR